MACDALRLTAVSTFYGDSQALDGVSFCLPAGRVLGLLGRNGAGKTTSIHSVMGFVPPRSGRIELFGEPITRLPPEAISRKGIGLVPQGRRIFSSLSVLENLTVAARKSAWASAAASWSLQQAYDTFPRLKERLKQAAGTLSGGEQQMLAIARAMMTNPRVLLLDEPSEGLAPRIVSEVAAALAKLKASGLSIILVEHNTRLALELADEVVILNTGHVEFTGSAADVRADEHRLNQLLGVY